jgi:hypothetical protein
MFSPSARSLATPGPPIADDVSCFSGLSTPRSTAPASLNAASLAAAAQTPLESLRSLLAQHFGLLYPHLSVLADASYAEFEDNFRLFVFDNEALRRLDQPKRYGARTVWSSAADYGHATVLIEGPAGVGKSSLFKLMARGQLTSLTVDDEAQLVHASQAAARGRSNSRSRAGSIPPAAGTMSSGALPTPGGPSAGSGASFASPPPREPGVPDGAAVARDSPPPGSTMSGRQSTTSTHGPAGAGGSDVPDAVLGGPVGTGNGRLVVLVELRHLALQCASHRWEKITPTRLLDSALRGLAGGRGGGMRAVESLAGLKAAVLSRPIVWLLDGFDEVWNAASPALQSFFRTFVFPDDEDGSSRPAHALPDLGMEMVEDVVFVTCREDRAVINHPVLAERRHRSLLRLQMRRWRTPDAIAFIDRYFWRFAQAHPEVAAMASANAHAVLNANNQGDAMGVDNSSVSLLVGGGVPSTPGRTNARATVPQMSAHVDAVTARLQEPTMNAWHGVPIMCDILCFMATMDLAQLARVSAPTEVLRFALDAMYRRNVPQAVARWPWLQQNLQADMLGPTKEQVFSIARDKALRVYETGSNVVMLDVSLFNGKPTNVGEFVLAHTGWLHRRSDVTDMAGTGDRQTHWYFAHRCFLEYLAATSLSAGEPKQLDRWFQANITLNAGERMMLSLLCHEVSVRHLKKHRELILDAVHTSFLKNYSVYREKVIAVIQSRPTFQERERLWELTGALIAVEVCVLLNDDRIARPKKHLGVVPHVKNPTYFLLLVEPAARFGSLTVLRLVEKALEADKRYTSELASRALSQALAHAPPGALLMFSLDGGGHRLVIDHLMEQGAVINIVHACECGSTVAVRRALNAQHHAPATLAEALATSVDHGFEQGVEEVLQHLLRSAQSGVGTVHPLCRGLSIVLGRALVVGQLGCFHAAASILGDREYELVVCPRPRRSAGASASLAGDVSAGAVGEAVIDAGGDGAHLVRFDGTWPIEIAESELPHPFSDRHLTRLVEACPSLMNLDVRGLAGSTITDDSLASVAIHCAELHSLNVSHTKGAVSDLGLCAIFANRNGMVSVDLADTAGRVTDMALSALAATCGATLEVVDASDNPVGITDQGVSTLAQAATSLKHVSLRNTPITDDAIKVIALCCHDLRSLDIGSNFGRITDESLHLLAERCRGLTSLDVSDADGLVTDAGLRSVAEHCHVLRFLDVSGCQGSISDRGVVAVSQYARVLQALDVTGARITDQGMSALGARCKSLRSLRVSANGGMSDRGLRDVAAGCTGLSTLHVDGKGHTITRNGVKAVAARCVNLQSLFVSGVM